MGDFSVRHAKTEVPNSFFLIIFFSNVDSMGYKQKLKQKRKAAQSVPKSDRNNPPEMAMALIVELFSKVGSLGSPTYPAILLHEELPGSVLKGGYGVLNDKAYFHTAWVEHDGKTYDPATEILQRVEDSFSDSVVLSETPKGLRVDDGVDTEIISRYLQDPESWWKHPPSGINRMRKFLRSAG